MLDTVLTGAWPVGFIVGAVGMTAQDPGLYPLPTAQLPGGEDEQERIHGTTKGRT